MFEAKEVRVRGTVQGVGFRPTVWRLAQAHRLHGEVLNDAEGVLIRISGEDRNITAFLECLPGEAPPLARIEAIEVRAFEPTRNYRDFRINGSSMGGSHTGVSADAATCSQCAQEIDDPTDRRYLYPFSNCTHCGPRLSIIQAIPYDRGNTTMSGFAMCSQCRAEYRNPADRRFHAQPIACHRCGPRVYLESIEDSETSGRNRVPLPPAHQSAGSGFGPLSGPRGVKYTDVFHQSNFDDAVELTLNCLNRVVDALRQGKIVALRGIGGFHLCCDASNDSAVRRLRQRKHRYAKPFALMAPDVQSIEVYCRVSALEREQLLSFRTPIVLLDKKPPGGNGRQTIAAQLSEQIAPGSGLLGFMLPYTPLHRLIAERFKGPLIMTSGNLSDEPQIIDNREAKVKLKQIADVILFHNREIANRIDDSVLRCMAGKARLLRRARGYAPQAIPMPPGFEKCPDLLAYGGELKSTFCLLKDGAAILSQHQGDLEDAATFDDYEKNLNLYQQLFQHRPRILVTDKHPEYLSSKLAKKNFSARQLQEDGGAATPHSLRLIEVQHHHAHIASCLAENGVAIDTPEVLGIALDGLGYGDAGAIWGGEFLLADYSDYRRVGGFKAVAMLGGFKAITEPWRNTYAHILEAMGWAVFKKRYGASELCAYLEKKPLATLDQMLARQFNAPLASSCGRLFDAVSAALGICRDQARFEGQGAIELEMRVDPALFHSGQADAYYPFDILASQSGGDSRHQQRAFKFFTLDSGRMWISLLDDLNNHVWHTVIATRFHAGLITALMSMVKALGNVYSFTSVALSGGCLQNKFLLEGLSSRLEAMGFECFTQARVPANDGGLCLGQAAIGAARVLAVPSDSLAAKVF
ncbi:MAG: carbamoyltransferase HypF [Methylococcaceae bacterium]|nr:carbamoyltransferase HypF [Methylococcaceae bacterium]